MKKTKKLLIAGGLAIVALLILPFLVPTQTYLQKAESVATEELGVPVSIENGHLRFLPSPRLVASSIVMGKNQDITIEKLVIVPTLNSIFSETKQFDLKVVKPVINKTALSIISALAARKSEGTETAAVNVRHIKVDEMQFVWPDSKLPILNAEIALTKLNRLDTAVIKSLDGKLTADIKPNGDAHSIIVNANKWTLPVGLPLLIDQAKLEMHLKDNRLTIPKMDFALYGGKVMGDAVFTWQKNALKKNSELQQKATINWKTNGHLNANNLSIKQPSIMMNKNVYLSGNISGDGSFSASAKEVGQLVEHMQGDFKFKINHGVLHGLDLVNVASLLVKQSESSGATQFDVFSGLLNVSGKQYHLRDLNISSGLLAATGQVKVKPNKQLDGAVEVKVKNSAGLAAIPLSVSGTVNKPVVLPSKMALIGAAAGTAILGPGVGTSLGIKAAGALDSIKNLFGDNK